jgi:hypothetical protein
MVARLQAEASKHVRLGPVVVALFLLCYFLTSENSFKRPTTLQGAPARDSTERSPEAAQDFWCRAQANLTKFKGSLLSSSVGHFGTFQRVREHHERESESKACNLIPTIDGCIAQMSACYALCSSLRILQCC